MPSAALHALGVDVGSTNVKVVLVRIGPEPAPVAGSGAASRTVTEVVVRSAPTPSSPDALVRAVRDLVRDALSGRPAPVAVGIASMAETGAALDADGRPLTELVRWDGRRGGPDAEGLAERLGRVELFWATGVRASAKVPLVTWAWLRRTEPHLWRRVARWGGVADLVALAMTGDLVTDHTLAGRTMAYRLPPVGVPVPDAFDADLLAEVGLAPEQLPRVARPGEPAGPLVDDAFVTAGIPAGTPVVLAGHDHAVGTWAAGVRAPGDRADSIGTAEAVLTVLGGPVDRPAVAREGMSLVRTTAGTHEALLAGSPAAGAMVAWWRGTVLHGPGLGEIPETGTGAGAGTPGQPTGLVVLPYPHGRQSPAPDPEARVRVVDEARRDVSAAVLGTGSDTSAPDRALPDAGRATTGMLEGLAHHARWMLDAQRRLVGGAGAPAGLADASVPATRAAPLVVLAGAAGSNGVWMDSKAALSDGPLHLVAAAEPVATGAALLAAEGAGLVPPGSVRLPTRVVVAPAGDREEWRRAQARFVATATGAGVEPATDT